MNNTMISKLRNDSTPFIFLRMGNDALHCYWWNRQVVVIAFKDHSYLGYYRTGGSGFNKEDAALDEGFRMLGKAPRGWYEGATYTDFRKGGNYYLVPKKEIRNYG
jgi:hypothetical protein